MKKFLVVLLGVVMACSVVACSNKNDKEAPTVVATNDTVEVKNIGTESRVVVDEQTGETSYEWVPAAGRVGAYVDVFEGIDDDNARAIVENAGVADEAGYTAYILLGTKVEADSTSYAYIAYPKSDVNTATDDVIIVVKVGSDGATEVTEFEGTREDIVGSASAETAEETTVNTETTETNVDETVEE